MFWKPMMLAAILMGLVFQFLGGLMDSVNAERSGPGFDKEAACRRYFQRVIDGDSTAGHGSNIAQACATLMAADSNPGRFMPERHERPWWVK